jgi:hypothetical protein
VSAVPAAAWTVENSEGQLLSGFVGGSRREVGRKIVPARYDAFRLQVSSSYREAFDRDLEKVLAQRAWRIVPLRQRGASQRRAGGSQLELSLQ